MAPAPAPIAFRAALPFGRQALSVDAEGEARLVLALSATEVPGLVTHWARLQDATLMVAIVPEGELKREPQRPGGWGKKRKPQEA